MRFWRAGVFQLSLATFTEVKCFKPKWIFENVFASWSTFIISNISELAWCLQWLNTNISFTYWTGWFLNVSTQITFKAHRESWSQYIDYNVPNFICSYNYRRQKDTVLSFLFPCFLVPHGMITIQTGKQTHIDKNRCLR